MRPRGFCDPYPSSSNSRKRSFISEAEPTKLTSDLSINQPSRPLKRHCSSRPQNNILIECLKPIFHRVKSVGGSSPGLNLNPGKSVELKDKTFMKITKIWRDEAGSTMLRGHHLIRQNSLAPKMPRCCGELVWNIECKSSPKGPHREIRERVVSVDCVLKPVKITFTNATYPAMSREDKSVSNDSSKFYCRFKYCQVDGDREYMKETSIERLRDEEADPTARVPDDVLRAEWRGSTRLGGSQEGTTSFHDLEQGISGSSVLQKYTFGDAFCGGGGVSRGAKQAGLHEKWAFDADQNAMKTFRANFELDGTLCLCCDVADFLLRVRRKSWYMIDILHASPPCQPYSPAHTTSKNPERDEANQAVLFSMQQLIEQVKPRIVTMEETEGLYVRHYDYFYALIQTFVGHGYSVRWAVVNTIHYGIPQTRRRVFLFAAGPGEKLPLFPKATHGPGLIPHTTIADFINSIPRGTPNHETDVRFKKGPKPPFDPNSQARTLTTNGGEKNYHPKGHRNYTAREMALLQTFPLNHSFASNNKTAVKKQVGNAVPPLLAKVFLKACIKSLQESDRKEITHQRPSSNTPPDSDDPTAVTSTPPRRGIPTSAFTFTSPLQRSFSESDEGYVMID